MQLRPRAPAPGRHGRVQGRSRRHGRPGRREEPAGQPGRPTSPCSWSTGWTRPPRTRASWRGCGRSPTALILVVNKVDTPDREPRVERARARFSPRRGRLRRPPRESRRASGRRGRVPAVGAGAGGGGTRGRRSCAAADSAGRGRIRRGRARRARRAPRRSPSASPSSASPTRARPASPTVSWARNARSFPPCPARPATSSRGASRTAGERFEILDTAGIRRRSRVTDSIEYYSVDPGAGEHAPGRPRVPHRGRGRGARRPGQEDRRPRGEGRAGHRPGPEQVGPAPATPPPAQGGERAGAVPVPRAGIRARRARLGAHGLRREEPAGHGPGGGDAAAAARGHGPAQLRPWRSGSRTTGFPCAARTTRSASRPRSARIPCASSCS